MGAVVHSPSFSAMRMEFFTAGPYNSCVPSPSAEFFSTQHLFTDPIGTFTLTLTNVAVGSTLRVESQSAGTSLYDGTAATTSPAITLSCYAGGGTNDLNNLRIKVRKGTTSPFYQPYETLATAIVGAQSIFVSQISDE